MTWQSWFMIASCFIRRNDLGAPASLPAKSAFPSRRQGCRRSQVLINFLYSEANRSKFALRKYRNADHVESGTRKKVSYERNVELLQASSADSETAHPLPRVHLDRV